MEGDDAMPPSTERTRLTYDDFVLFPDDGKRHELIDGEHFVTPSPNLRHQELLGRLHVAIATHLSSRRHLGRVFCRRSTWCSRNSTSSSQTSCSWPAISSTS
jgi:hypothetical protein